MNPEDIHILITEDDIGHATLIQKNLKRAGIINPMIHFKDGQEIIDFLFRRGASPHRKSSVFYLLLLDIRLPKVDGVEVLRRIKENEELKKIPVLMITTTDDPREIENCYKLGCNTYVTKPIDHEKFIDAIKRLGLFIKIIQVPQVYQMQEKE